MKPVEGALDPYAQIIEALPFVQEIGLSKEPGKSTDPQVNGVLTLRTPKGSYSFLVEQKRSYLDRGHLNAIIAQANVYSQKYRKPLLLLARYIPAPSAEKLIKADINFVDTVGNMHLVLGNHYERTITGKRESAPHTQAARLTPAMAQLLFTFTASDQAGNWTVRTLAEASGLSKSSAAKVRQQLLDRGILYSARGSFYISRQVELEDELLRSYELALRPKLFLGRFRAAQSDTDALLDEIRPALLDLSLRWSLTGGPAVYELQHFYRGAELPLFVEDFSDASRRKWRVMPDKTGPMILLRSFGTLPYWKETNGLMISHPWLIYAELMYSSDSRAHEAAQKLKTQFLTEMHA